MRTKELCPTKDREDEKSKLARFACRKERGTRRLEKTDDEDETANDRYRICFSIMPYSHTHIEIGTQMKIERETEGRYADTHITGREIDRWIDG